MLPCTFIAISLVAASAWFDLRDREIPNGLPVALLATALGAQWLGCRGSWLGASSGLDAAVGGVAGLGLGFLAFRTGLFGGGDAKLCAGLGACLGPAGLAVSLVAAALCAGPAALWARHRGDPEFAAAPVLAIGAGAALLVSPATWLDLLGFGATFPA